VGQDRQDGIVWVFYFYFLCFLLEGVFERDVVCGGFGCCYLLLLLPGLDDYRYYTLEKSAVFLLCVMDFFFCFFVSCGAFFFFFC
jgi:hypothetical protein